MFMKGTRGLVITMVICCHVVMGFNFIKRAAPGVEPGGTHMAAGRKSQCRGGFDVYFLLDSSSSVTNEHFQKQTVDFVEALVGRFTSADLRISFISFSSETRAETILELTENRGSIQRGIKSLRQHVTGGGTFLYPGLELANDQIQYRGGDAASVIIALTDGKLDDRREATQQADKSRKMGASVLAVRVGESEVRDLQDVADKPSREHIFRGDSFNDLENIIDKIVNTSCVEILGASPLTVCTDEIYNITIFGNGFTKTSDLGKVICNFRLNDTDNQEVRPYSVNSTHLTCPVPMIEEDGSFVVLQVSVNGISFISSNVTITAEGCEPPNIGGVLLGLFLALLIIGLIAAWWFWNVLCCVVVTKPAAPKPVPPSPNNKQWPVVDASLYGGGGPGGMRPVTVRWGQGGSTEAASHLEKAKNAEVVAMIDESENLPSTPKPSFKDKLAAFFAPLKSLYERVSVMRPAPEDKGKCMRVQRERL
ncbi:putative anthrax toxin receptor 1 [Apostichopus japonicus]|uniref:Putative anthrax toxin receptor 1 n=1 Tax=Stichopus japonicus TaxID=307972 RepID=A0A2G8K3G5_STIJA|nr:putative anthrax toxin receptor 1 [Apostichopus japonicus]